jgi:hypothetical protein
MRSLLRLLQGLPRPTPPPTRQRDSVAFQFADGQRIDVQRVRDPRARRIKLAVDERGVRLTLPLRAAQAAGMAFLHEHAHWLAQQLATQAAAHGQHVQRQVTTHLPLRGAELALHWRPGRTTQLALDAAGELRCSAPASAGSAALQRALRDFYEAQGRADVGRWLPAYLPSLPRAPRRVVFKRTSGQWGSLAPDATLSLDLALVLARPSAFEYVLVHELCHLLHANHSAAFWQAVAARFPQWRDERDYLRSEGRALKGRLRQLLAG